MEQAISKLPTSSKFHSAASEPQLIPTQLDFLTRCGSCGRSSGSNSSYDSGRAWEERILDLSAELQQICGSPLSPPCFVGGAPGSPEHPKWPTTSTTTASVASSPPPRLPANSPRAAVPSTVASTGSVFDRRSNQCSTTTPLRLTCSLGRCSDGSSGADLVRRAISLQGGQSPDAVSGYPRSIMVRHEETQETLAKRLSAICGKSSQPVAAGVKDQQNAASAPEETRSVSKLRADVTAGGTGSNRVRIKADVAPYRAEDITVTVNDDRLLTVDANDGTSTRHLHRTELPAGVADCLLCHMNSSGSMYILERPRSTGLSVEFTGTRSIFLPVIHCDEIHLVMTLVLRVPDDFRFEELGVKTVDSNVWITGCRKRGISPLSASSDAFLFPTRHGSKLQDGAKPRFRVVVPLPKGCDNRSVVAALSSNNQLILKAKLRAACRRYTF